MLDPDHPELRVGALVWVQIGGQLIFPKPIAIEKIYEHEGKKWFRVEGSATGLTADNLTLAANASVFTSRGRYAPPGGGAEMKPQPTDPWDPNVRAADVPVVEGGDPDPFDDPASEFETADAPLRPNRLDIDRHLFELFSPTFVHDYPDAQIEIAYADMAASQKPDAAKQFSVFDLKKAADYAEIKNKAGFNVYVGPALRKAGSKGRAKDNDVVTSAFAWSDHDEPEGAERIDAVVKEKNIVPAIVVGTGRTPHPRFHVYVKLDGSVTPDELRAANTALKTLFGSDDVQNPSRIMRLAGTINYPTKDKLERGYVAELVTLHIRKDAPAYAVGQLTGLAGKPSGTVWFRQQVRP